MVNEDYVAADPLKNRQSCDVQCDSYFWTGPNHAAGIVKLLIEIQDEPTSAHRMLRLDALCWWLIGLDSREGAEALWKSVGDCAAITRAMTLR